MVGDRWRSGSGENRGGLAAIRAAAVHVEEDRDAGKQHGQLSLDGRALVLSCGPDAARATTKYARVKFRPSTLKIREVAGRTGSETDAT